MAIARVANLKNFLNHLWNITNRNNAEHFIVGVHSYNVNFMR